MKTTIKTIQINYKKRKENLKVGEIELTKRHISISDIESSSLKSFLLIKNHQYTDTQVDLTGAKDCQIVSFNEKLEFVGIRFYKNHKNAPFSYLINEPYLLIILNNSIEIEYIFSIVILDD